MPSESESLVSRHSNAQAVHLDVASDSNRVGSLIEEADVVVRLVLLSNFLFLCLPAGFLSLFCDDETGHPLSLVFIDQN